MASSIDKEGVRVLHPWRLDQRVGKGTKINEDSRSYLKQEIIDRLLLFPIPRINFSGDPRLPSRLRTTFSRSATVS